LVNLSIEKRRRYSLLLSNSEQLFNRLNSDIYHLQSKCLSLTGFLTANLSIVVALIIFLFLKGWNPSVEGYIFISLPIILITISLLITLKDFTPGKFSELNILDEERFTEITQMSEEELYSDTIYNYREAYKYNKNKYNKMLFELKISLYLYLIAIILLFLLVISILFGGI